MRCTHGEKVAFRSDLQGRGWGFGGTRLLEVIIEEIRRKKMAKSANVRENEFIREELEVPAAGEEEEEEEEE